MLNPRHVGSTASLTIVIKLGTSSIIDADTHMPLLTLLSSIVETICKLKALGHRVVLVSSGAIGVGLKRMGMKSRGKGLSEKQALAAIGQGRLIALWDNLFSQLEQPIAQILLTRGDLADRTRYLNAANTLTELLAMGVVPIVNENDSVGVLEIRFGDNDTLSAITANIVHADYLFLMTDVDCLYTDNPRKNPDAKPVRVVDDIEDCRRAVSTATLGTSLGTGGMETKIIAAELATVAGVTTVILNSQNIESVFPIIASSDSTDEATLPQHTRFLRKEHPMGDRKWWIMHGLHAAGSITIDAGAYQALLRKESGGRLLAAGVLSVEGTFASQQAVKIFVRRRKRWESVAAPPLSSPYDLLTRSVTETPNYPNHQSHQHQHTASSSSSSSYRPPSSTFNSSQQLPSSSLGSASYLSSPNLNLTEPNTPNIIPAMSLSSSIASLDPLSRSNPDSPALIAQHAQAMRRIDGWDLNASLGGGGSSESVNGEGDTTARSDKDDEWELLEVGKGQANYNWSEMDRIKGCKSDKIFEILGYAESGYVVESITIRERT